jgi:DNA repair protein RecO (recombination protein O)
MNEIDAILYKLTRYSDRSAIATAFTPQYGKVKLFIKNAYTKFGGPVCFVPGILNFSMKENSELHRYNSFECNCEYYDYLQNQEIALRLQIVFDFFEQLFHAGECCRVLWKLTLKFNGENYRSIFIYTIYRLLKAAGIWFFNNCKCGELRGNLYILNGEIMCDNCINPEHKETVTVNAELVPIFSLFTDSAAYINKAFTSAEEYRLVELFEKYIVLIYGKPNILKSAQVFLNIKRQT